MEDLNGDGTDELILLESDYIFPAFFLTANGKPKLLDAYWLRYRCAILDSGLLHTFSSDGAIYRWLMDDGVLGDKEKIADAPSDIYTSDYMIEYAGGWMFIYKLFNEHKGSEYPFGALGQQLKMKVDLESGEVIYNQVELDFSVLESYQEE